ncbi:hypothetical protein HMPREF3198_00253 [Winkia neuii]|nr:hypothetical protein HMPREF3198_00253 [Winkia neuii]
MNAILITAPSTCTDTTFLVLYVALASNSAIWLTTPPNRETIEP